MQVNGIGDARQRSGTTKRTRSRQALIDAATAVFERGWFEARVEDIARAAGVSSATAYNHFPGGKQELIGVVYAPLIQPLIEAAEADAAEQRDPLEAVERHIRSAAEVARRHRALTVPLVVAVSEQIARVGRPTVPDARDVRLIVRWTTSLTLLLAYGQERGVFRDQPPAEDLSSYHINALLQRVFSRPDESAEETADLVLGQLLPAVRRLGRDCCDR
ncbi:TetR/AcrR family transcriptional regulator [Lentzea sp. NEAU-D13]|uniref:TetR/AcrR family transcriptional regulator n=1 Tax=Lentzea alba TaxID=2714351 RepID=A0A7C9VVX7_9PSEU|nr:TetR/AcrR family transcriptional regulator [Lentzea alba]NGY65333.1 TetR/AcrR family transcriptional regulator [Lentzea alba]